MNTNINSLAPFCRTLPCFQDLDNDELETLLHGAHVKTYPKGHILFHRGDKAEHYYVIFDGWIELYRDTPKGDEAVVGIFTRCDSFGEAVMLENSRYTFNAKAVEECRLIELPAANIKTLASQNQKIVLRCIQNLSEHIEALELEKEHLSLMTSTQRVICFLLQMCLGLEHCDGHLSFPYNKNLAAARLGMKTETFSRILKEIPGIGVNVKGNEIFIADRKKLEEYSCSHCSYNPPECLLAQKNLCKCRGVVNTRVSN